LRYPRAEHGSPLPHFRTRNRARRLGRTAQSENTIAFLRVSASKSGATYSIRSAVIGWMAAARRAVFPGVPWQRGTVRKEQTFALTSADGAALPVQSWTLAYWPDGSIKWVTLDFTADLKANEKKAYGLAFGKTVTRSALR